MVELQQSQFPLAQPLFIGTEHFVIPQAVLAGHNPGRIFVDEVSHPTAAFLWTTCGFYFLTGDAHNGQFQQDLHDLLCDKLIPPLQERGENGFVLVPLDPSWDTGQDVILKGRQPVKIYRRLFNFDPERFATFQQKLGTLADGFTLHRLDSTQIVQLPELSGEINLTWGNPEAFVAHGRGFCLLHEGELVSACLSVFASEVADEISISTNEPHRRQGWGAVVAAAYIENCLAGGRYPNWECWWENEPSMKLAQKLGYTMSRDYPVWYWEEA